MGKQSQDKEKGGVSQQSQRKSNRHGDFLHSLERQFPDLWKWQTKRQHIRQDVDRSVGDSDDNRVEAFPRNRRVKQPCLWVTAKRVDETKDKSGEEHQGKDDRGGGAEVGHDFEDAIVHEQDGCFGGHHGPLVQELCGEVNFVGRGKKEWRHVDEMAAEAKGDEDAGQDNVGTEACLRERGLRVHG